MTENTRSTHSHRQLWPPRSVTVCLRCVRRELFDVDGLQMQTNDRRMTIPVIVSPRPPRGPPPSGNTSAWVCECVRDPSRESGKRGSPECHICLGGDRERHWVLCGSFWDFWMGFGFAPVWALVPFIVRTIRTQWEECGCQSRMANKNHPRWINNIIFHGTANKKFHITLVLLFEKLHAIFYVPITILVWCEKKKTSLKILKRTFILTFHCGIFLCFSPHEKRGTSSSICKYMVRRWLMKSDYFI